jgi:DNA-binding NarL/FixJ family response regulator
MTSILIADDHEVVRAGLRALLNEREDWQVVAEAADGREAVAQAVATVPNVAIVDYAMPLLNGVEVTRQIRQGSPGTEVIIFTMHDNNSLIRDLLQAGALGYLLKSDAKQLLLTAIDTVAAHKPFFTGMIAETLRQSFLTKGHVNALSPRERSVVQLIAEGHGNKRIAAFSISALRQWRRIARPHTANWVSALPPTSFAMLFATAWLRLSAQRRGNDRAS